MSIQGWLQEDESGKSAKREGRVRVLLEATGASAAGDSIAVTVHNISASGMLLECAATLGIGDALWVDLPDARDCEAVVRWTSGRLFGCQFARPLERATLSAAQLRSAIGDEGAALQTEPSDLGEPLGRRLQNLRKSRGLTLAELAKALSVSKPTVWAWEQGRSVPTPDRFERIASVLGTSVSALRTGVDADVALALVERSRRQIAEAYSVAPGKVRIMIEL